MRITKCFEEKNQPRNRNQEKPTYLGISCTQRDVQGAKHSSWGSIQAGSPSIPWGSLGEAAAVGQPWTQHRVKTARRFSSVHYCFHKVKTTPARARNLCDPQCRCSQPGEHEDNFKAGCFPPLPASPSPWWAVWRQGNICASAASWASPGSRFAPVSEGSEGWKTSAWQGRSFPSGNDSPARSRRLRSGSSGAETREQQPSAARGSGKIEFQPPHR